MLAIIKMTLNVHMIIWEKWLQCPFISRRFLTFI